MREESDQQLSEREKQRLEALRREEILRAEREAAETGARWGLLPPKIKEAILNEKWEEWPLEYQRQIREFLEAVNR